MKQCSRCKETLTPDQFYPDKTKKTGLSSQCRTCRKVNNNKRYYADKVAWGEKVKEWRQKNPDKARGMQLRSIWKRQYGLTPCQVARQRIEQMGCCAICGVPTDDWTIDHCHTTHAVRGILCRNCNFAIGHLRDSTAALRNAITYLESGGVWATSTSA